MRGVSYELYWCPICERVKETGTYPHPVWVGEGRIADRLLALAPWIAEALAEIREGA